VKKKIVITGGSNGIGLELLHYYLKKKNTVYTTYLSSKKELIKLKKKYKDNLFFKKMDLGNIKDITKFSETIKKNSNSIDIIILNALNKIKRKKFNKIKKKEITESLNKNFLGNFFFLQIISKFFLLEKKIKILHISSIVSKKGSWGLSNYGPAKAAVDNLFKCLQYEFKNKIKFRSIYLGAVDTKGYRYTNGSKSIYKTIKAKEAVHKIIKI
jgi:short-subunit dehydrogenase